MRRHTLAFSSALLSLLAVAPLTGAQTPARAVPKTAGTPANLERHGAEGLYVLTPPSQTVRGCFDPCLCPLFFLGETLGSFRLRELPVTTADGFRHFAVTDMQLTVGFQASLHVAGEGHFRTGFVDGQPVQEMVLQLSIDGAPAETFDSGLVPGRAFGRSPRISIAVDMNDRECFDTVFSIEARPVRSDLRVAYEVGPGSASTLGCLPPCHCPILAQNLRGSFDLLPLGIAGGERWFAVLDVRLGVGGFLDLDPLPTSPLASGHGFYRVAADGSGQHAMDLFLDVVDQGPTIFRSGEMPGAGLPAIDISVADNEFTCFNRVLSLDATPAP